MDNFEGAQPLSPMPEGCNWFPFVLAPTGKFAPAPRSIKTAEGVADRLRAAAFAEIQAKEAFLWASQNYTDVPADLRGAWRVLSVAEDKHLGWLLTRMSELGIDPAAREVSDFLWQSFRGCTSGRQFALFIANAEERGRIAGERFYHQLKGTDSITAEIFRKIAEEELEHIELARRFFPDFSPGLSVDLH